MITDLDTAHCGLQQPELPRHTSAQLNTECSIESSWYHNGSPSTDSHGHGVRSSHDDDDDVERPYLLMNTSSNDPLTFRATMKNECINETKQKLRIVRTQPVVSDVVLAVWETNHVTCGQINYEYELSLVFGRNSRHVQRKRITVTVHAC